MHETDRAILELTAAFAGSLPARDVREVEDLIRAGEPVVAFETLCTQLFEYDVPVDAVSQQRFASLGRMMRVDPNYWQDLKGDG